MKYFAYPREKSNMRKLEIVLVAYCCVTNDPQA